ncbi:MAG: 3'-5' exonuclease [Gemmatimonadaceae bacterium]|nr:3'-5' exonuclease [Gemmatimonadaceae bacterium]
MFARNNHPGREARPRDVTAEHGVALPGLRERPGDALLIARARAALASGPLAPSMLLGQVLALPGAPPVVAARIADALFSRHADFVRTDAGDWALRAGATLAGSPGEPGTRMDEMAVRSLRYAVVDVETTGSGVRLGHRITEIAVVPIDDGEVGEPFTTLVNPQRSIPPQIVALTRITWEMVRSAPEFSHVSREVVERLRGRVFVAHNATFDWRFVTTEIARAGGPSLDGDRLCTVRMARALLPQLRRRSLDALAEYFGVTITERHRAGGDAVATAHILCRLLALAEEQGHDTWPSLSARLDRRTSRARRRRSAMPRSVDYDPTI